MNNTKPTVLVVEDDDSLREIFVMTLASEGFNVIEAENGKVALELLLSLAEDNLPQCIIVDHIMPVMNGRVFLEILRSSYGSLFNHIPAIACSAFGEPINPHYISATLEKPLSLLDLVSTINSVLVKRSQSELAVI